MALVNHAKHEINAKIVFCGPAGAGKATLFKAICSRLPAENRGQLRSMSIQQDKMLFFDFTHPEGSDADKYSLRLHVYTLTGDITHGNAWKMVLKGVDGVAFVADSIGLRQDANRQTFEQMQAALHANGKRFADIPSAIVCTKQDLPEAIPAGECDLGGPTGSVPVFAVDSLTGSAVLDPLCAVLEGILAELEGLELSLQPGARTLCNLSSGRGVKPPVDFAPGISVPEPLLGKVAGAEDDRLPTISFDGRPELSSDGTLSVGIMASCCGKSSKSTLKISLTHGS
ncbi:mutual gliding-motility protein MglA [Geobacter sp. OR-1]|uniref:GTP-binding protein n=1 Tax=Geobacter sp. OR-1 TaxID=1266765 RepID=UPI00054441C5|nr:ADP-ribosylation factor-like protein [Geobacter sp. OR-1]GAM11605.1 mutual gliding-motility protein MglA [Geobacter sp. OR-1]